MPEPTTFETDRFPYVPARWQTKVAGKRDIRLIVIHAMEAPEKGQTAENVANYFQHGSVKSSAHYCVDSDSILQCVYDNNVAYAAPHVNHDGIHIEHAGYAKQSRAEWLDPYGVLMLERSAYLCAHLCRKFGLPVVHLTDAELKRGKKGIIGHVQATRMYKPNNGHQDPGPEFPWEWYITRVRKYHESLIGTKPPTNL